jgi:hypothetical protein
MATGRGARSTKPVDPKPLSCGGKGPCCHVGYAHKHCEHCDVVISLMWSYTPLPYVPLPYTPTHPFNPYYSDGIYNTFGDVFTQGALGMGGGGHAQNGFTRALEANTLEASWKTDATAADSLLDVTKLPDPTTAHVCQAVT